MQSQITRFPIIKPFVKTINRDVKKVGLQGAMVNTVTRSGTKLVIEGSTREVKRVLGEEACVVVSNHPHEVDIIALFAALPARPDTSLVINSRFLNLVPNADKYLIPVYIEHHGKRNREQIREKLFKKFHPVTTFAPDEEHKKNIQSIKNASLKVSNGELVVIFPNPTKNKNRKWYPGVGYLLKGTRREKPIYVVRAYIEGTSNLDYLRFIPHAAKLLTPIRVTFSKPILVNKMLQKDAKSIAAGLNENYVAWVKKLKSTRD